MNYTIQINKNIPTGLKLTFRPENKVVSSFFHSIGLEGFMKVLSAILSNHGIGLNLVGFIFYEEMDEDDKKELEIEKDEVLIYEQQLGEVIIKKKEFYSIVYHYAKKIIEHSSIIDCPVEFKYEIEKKLESIKEKIE